MKLKTTIKYILLSAVAASGLSTSNAMALTATMDNWRLIYMNGQYPGGGSKEQPYIYSLHTPRQENLLVHFDLSQYAGMTAASDALLTLRVSSDFPGIMKPGIPVYELWQLNAYNAGVNLDQSGSFYLDQASASPTGTAWRNNAGNNLVNLNYNNSIMDISSSMLSTFTGPLAGDTQSTNPNDGALLTFSISQLAMQAWLNGTAPSIAIVSAGSNNPWTGGVLFYTDATVSFNASSVPEPTQLMLFSVAAFALLRRRFQIPMA